MHILVDPHSDFSPALASLTQVKLCYLASSQVNLSQKSFLLFDKGHSFQTTSFQIYFPLHATEEVSVPLPSS